MSGHNITWGKVLVGAAVAAGAMAAFVVAQPYLAETVVPTLKELASAAGDSIAKAWSWVAENVIGHASYFTDNAEKAMSELHEAKGIVGLITSNPGWSIGTAAVAGGLLAKRRQGQQLHLEGAEERSSFAMREEMRAADALMAARMAATGYQPAMAMAGRGR